MARVECNTTRWGYVILFFLASFVYVVGFHYVSQTGGGNTARLCAMSFVLFVAASVKLFLYYLQMVSESLLPSVV
jgi:heme/copper-type cytochrome/quinol oxidase subunit 4